MNNLPLSLLLAAALALPGAVATSRATAQDAGAPAAEPGGPCHHGRGPHMEHRLERLTQRLGLDANQVALVRQAFEQARAEHEALRAQPPSPERHEQHRAIMQRTMERIDAVLTPAQRATFQQMREQRRERMERRHRRGAAMEPRGI